MVSEVPEIAKNWWLFAVLGVICVATGIAALVWPEPRCSRSASSSGSS